MTKNELHIGLQKHIPLPKSGLFINDELPKLPDKYRAQIFDPLKHHFNPLAQMDYLKASRFVQIIDALFERGNSTLTKDTGLDFIGETLETPPTSLADLISIPEKKATTGHIWAYNKIKQLTRSPILNKVLSKNTHQFPFNTTSLILAKIDRAELGDFDALALGLLLISQYKGQLIIPDLAFYGRDIHTNLISQNRLIAGVNYLDELKRKAPELRQAVLLIKDKIPNGVLYKDAIELAQLAGHRPDPDIDNNDYNNFIDDAMAS